MQHLKKKCDVICIIVNLEIKTVVIVIDFYGISNSLSQLLMNI